ALLGEPDERRPSSRPGIHGFVVALALDVEEPQEAVLARDWLVVAAHVTIIRRPHAMRFRSWAARGRKWPVPGSGSEFTAQLKLKLRALIHCNCQERGASAEGPGPTRGDPSRQ